MDLRKDTSDDFHRILKYLFYSSVEYDCYELQRAIKGLGTDEEVSIEILTIRSNRRLQKIQDLYPKRKNLSDILRKERLTSLFLSKCSIKL